MDTAVARPAPQTLVPAEDGFAARVLALPARLKLGLAAGLLALVAVVMVMVMARGQGGEHRVLFANLSDKDGGAIVERLSQMNVPYRVAEGGSAILVPAAQVHELRLKLASAGLPKSGVAGCEAMDKTSIGQTQFQERLQHQRCLEGELARSIGSLASVQSARVHLAMPQANGFFREQQKPSASVLLALHPGRSLERAQIAGIVHLVSSSVPELSPKAVSVLDGSGALLSGQDGRDGEHGGLDGQQLQYVKQVEAQHLKRVLELLEPVVGRENLRATVTADIDFSQVESTSEEFKPNQGDGATATVRATRSEESSQPGAATPSGVPGAASNQPPVPATAPLTGAAQPLQGATGGVAAGNLRREAETRFEVDKTVRVTRNATGTVKRLSAAVVVNHRSSTDPRGRVTTAPLPQEELDKLTALVEQGIGFVKERGDVVRVINVPFRAEPAPKAEEVPLLQQPWLSDLLRAAAMPLALAVVALVVVFTLIRPALKAALAPVVPPPGSQLAAVVDDPQALPGGGPAVAQLEAPRPDERLEQARQLARQNPAAVANIMRTWVGTGAS